jgi:hypothetical protein
MNDTENSLVFALTGKSGQQHGIIALLAVVFDILADPSDHSDVLKAYGIALSKPAYLPSVQGDTPAMAEMLNRCGHSSQQACFKCWEKGDIARKTFEGLKGSNSTYALKLDLSAAAKTETQLREATKNYRSLRQVQAARAETQRTTAEATQAKLRAAVAAAKKVPAKRRVRPQRRQAPLSTLGSSVGQKRAKKSSKSKKKKRASNVKSLLLETLQQRVAGQGATPWLILPYMMMTKFGGIDDGMHTLIIGVVG